MLHVEESGSGERVVVLLHGLMGSAQSWWRVADLLADRGRRVLALDLPGHGTSPRDPRATVERVAAAVDESLDGVAVEAAIGHSFGGLALGAARFPRRVPVHVDAPFRTRGGWDLGEVRDEYAASAAERTALALAASRPSWSARDCEVEAAAARAFDPATAASIAAAPGGQWWPAPGSIVLRAEPSDYVSDEDAAELRGRGVEVRGVPGAPHSIWYGAFDAFVAALPEVFNAR